MNNTRITLNCDGKLLSLEYPIVMGILNITPDSFYDGGRFNSKDMLLNQVEKMISEGVDIIDIGGMSSRPGAKEIETDEELKRVIPAIELIKKEFPEVFISIDTVKAKVADLSVNTGANIINDISAGSMDSEMYKTVADLEVPYILMHMQGTPENMQQKPTYEDVVEEVLDFFINEVGHLRRLGVKDIILDPGFGFGKSINHNYFLLKKMHVFKILDLPILAGISRKSMVFKLLDTTPEQSLTATSALHLVALQQGAKILRAHDVKEAKEVIKLWEQLEKM